MNVTKRKFNALIQGMGKPRAKDEHENRHNPSTSDPDPFTRPSPSSYIAAPAASPTPRAPSAASPPPAAMSSISADFLAKRRRLGETAGANLANSLANRGPPPQKSTSVSNVRLKSYSATGEVIRVDWKQDVPRYCPSDREQLIRRLATFQELTEWTPKPDRINEIEWAKRGWVCQGKERVRCTLCNKELVVNANKREIDGKEVPVVVGSDFEDGMVKKYAQLITEGHQNDCLWRKHGCHDSLLRLQLSNAQAALPGLRERYDELCARTPFLPYLFNLRVPSSLSLETIKSQLPRDFFTEPPPPSGTTSPGTINDVALVLALIGWGGLSNPKIGQVPNSAACPTCLRRLGLWMFKSKEADGSTGEVAVPAPMDHLDPVREHRFFCPWRNPDAQRNPGSKANEPRKAAWEVLVQTVRNAAYLRGDIKDKRLGRQRSKSTLIVRALSTPRAPAAPVRQSMSGASPPVVMLGPDQVATDDDDDEDDEKVRDAKDKARWARLRRVKSLFNTKHRKSLTRGLTLSRPGTGKSTATTNSTAPAGGASPAGGAKG